MSVLPVGVLAYIVWPTSICQVSFREQCWTYKPALAEGRRQLAELVQQAVGALGRATG